MGQPVAAGVVRTEVCVDSPSGVDIAVAAGADRIELCAALELDGLTPSPGLLRYALAATGGTDVAVQVLIRCRAGDFVFGADEIACMRDDVEFAVRAGAAGVVVGALAADGTVDVAAVEGWASAARSAAGFAGRPTITFHRAFDAAADQFAALEALRAAGIDRVLTSGGAPSAPAGADRLAELVTAAAAVDPALTILPGGGIRAANVRELLASTGVTEVHFSGRDAAGRTDPARVRAVLAAVTGQRPQDR